jgi:tetratricopeptide (TPR) repeat protein
MHRNALESLSAARPILSRLDRSRSPQELSADIVEAWKGTETALRALLDGSMTSGAALIHEARQRQFLTFDQANALAAFAAVSGRCADAAYRPTDNDLNAVREGFDQFDSSLQMAEGAPSHIAPGEAMSTKGLRLSPLGTPRPVPLPPEPQPWWFVAVVGVAVVAVLGASGWYAWKLLGGEPERASMDEAVEHFTNGRAAAAREAFQDIVRRAPDDDIAHAYLARIEREAGDLRAAREHATLAVQADPGSVPALREMAAVLLASRDYELARRFYVRVVEAAPDDLAAQGFLGCTLLKLGRLDEGNRWLERAGPGTWSACATPAATAGSPTKRSP